MTTGIADVEWLDAKVCELSAENARLRAALNKLVRKGTDGRWRTTQNGDADVTDIVEQAQDRKP